ncbi:MAG: hypothetical protein JRJ65_14370, partial [Deltaproteobacteria bacterium]|nr:hypothetical protein [Deltaproteobacteria bacterium]
EKTPVKARVSPAEVHAARYKQLIDGEFDIFVEGAQGPLFFMEGEGEFMTADAGPQPMRMMWVATVEPFACMLRGDTKYRTMKDLKPGITFAVPPGASPRSNCYGVAAWAGLKDNEWKMIEFGGMDAAVQAIPDGKADIVWWIPEAGNTFEHETNPKGLHWLDMDPAKEPEGAARALGKVPVWMFGEAPPTSVKSARGVNLVLVPTLFFVMDSLDEDLVYNMCKFTVENIDAIKEKHGSAGTMSLESMRKVQDSNFMPLHKGTIKYLKEKGMWSAADDKRQAYNLDVWDRYVKAYKVALADAKKKKMKIDPRNEEWVKLWRGHKKDIPKIKVMKNIP